MHAALTLDTFNALFKGLATFVPGVQQTFFDRTSGGGTGVADYCYGVWLKHLVLLWKSGMRQMPQTVLEMGPGRSLGTGLAALLSGAERYAGIDAVRHANASTTLPVLREMVALFERRAPRPRQGWPDYDDALDARLYPGHILTEERLARSLAAPRLERLAAAVQQLDHSPQHDELRYGTWRDADLLAPRAADLLFSHVVVSVVEDLEAFYGYCARALKPGGWMSHHIDLTSLEVCKAWNGHLRFSDTAWKLVCGRRPFFVNRARLSDHLGLMERNGFELVCVIRGSIPGGLPREELAAPWRDMSEDDHRCAHAFVVARKRA